MAPCPLSWLWSGAGELPGEVAGSAFGPRLQATLAIRNRVSRRDTVELCAELFGARISTGSADAILTTAADALELPYLDLTRMLRRAGHLNVDETGWRLRCAQRTLWGAFSAKLAVAWRGVVLPSVYQSAQGTELWNGG